MRLGDKVTGAGYAPPSRRARSTNLSPSTRSKSAMCLETAGWLICSFEGGCRERATPGERREGAQACFELHNLSLYECVYYVFFFISRRAHRLLWQAISDRKSTPMRSFTIATLRSHCAFGFRAPAARAAPCLIVTLTGTQGGPHSLMVRPARELWCVTRDDSNNCSALKPQFDAGRGTNMRSSQIGISPPQLDAIFLTHMHGDHTEGLADIMMLRWYLKGPAVDIVCSTDAVSTPRNQPQLPQIRRSYRGRVRRIRRDRRAPIRGRSTRAWRARADLAKVVTFEPKEEPQLVWSSGDVKVSAIRSTHIAGHASYRVDTPAGSAVIGGDAVQRHARTAARSFDSDQVERLAKGADIIVHSAMHPVMGPDRGSGFPVMSFYRQSIANDLGAMAQRDGAKYLMLTHLALPARRGAPQSVGCAGRSFERG